MTFFPKWESQNSDFAIPKFWMFIYLLNQTFFEHVMTRTYSFRKYFSIDVLQVLIKHHLTLNLRGFMVKSQILNLTPSPYFDHNSCISSLNEQCKGILGIYTSRPFQWYPWGPIWWLFTFSTKALNIWESCMNAIPKMEVHLGIIGSISCTFPHLWKCVSHMNTLS